MKCGVRCWREESEISGVRFDSITLQDIKHIVLSKRYDTVTANGMTRVSSRQ